MFGAIIGRSEALTLRLSMLYALLDGCDQIDVDHLNAAVALWNYCEASARRLFGDALGNQTADTILKDLRDCRPKGKTRTELSDLFKRHESSAAISVALSLLLNEGKARFEHKTTAGRPTEIWFAT